MDINRTSMVGPGYASMNPGCWEPGDMIDEFQFHKSGLHFSAHRLARSPFCTLIGSREIAPSLTGLFAQYGYWLTTRQWIIRSGGAGGSDEAFVGGARYAKGLKPESHRLEIYIPWLGFQGLDETVPGVIKSDLCKSALNSVYEFHPNPNALNQYAFKLMARNFNQVVGIQTRGFTLSRFVLGFAWGFCVWRDESGFQDCSGAEDSCV